MAEIKITQQMIKEYRTLIGNFVLSDSAISEMILNDIEAGKLPKEFAQLAAEAQKTGYNVHSSNLFGYGFSTNTNMGLSFEKTSKQQTKDPSTQTQISPKDFVEGLGLNIESGDGAKIYSRLSNAIIEIEPTDIKTLLRENSLEPSFDNISNVVEILYGVTLRNDEELKASEEQRNTILMQLQAANIMEKFFTLSAQWNDQYTDSLGLFGLGSEGFGYVINKLGLDGENHFQWADSCRKWAERAGKLSVLNPEKFQEEFKKIYSNDGKNGIDFDKEAFKNLLELVNQNKIFDKDGEITQEGKDTILKAFNFVLDNPNASTYNQVMNGFGEALIMIATLGWGATTKGGQMLATTSMATFSKAGVAIASKSVNSKLLQGALRFTGNGVKLLGPAINEGTKLAMYTMASGTTANATNRIVNADSEENSWEKFIQTEAMVMEGAKGSFAFGAFAGIFGSTVTQAVVQRVSKVSSKVTTALADKFAKGAVDANEVFSTYLAKSVPTGALEKVTVELAAFVTDVVGFTAFETAIALFEQVKNLPENEQPQKFTEILWEHFKDQGYNLGQIKIVSHLVMWMSGSRGARMASTEYLKQNLPQLNGATIEQMRECYKIKLRSGAVVECKNATEMLASLNLMVRGETALSGKFIKAEELNKENITNIVQQGEKLLGNDVTVTDPKTVAPVEKTVTKLHNTNEQIEIEGNGQRYSTNDGAEVKGEVVTQAQAGIRNSFETLKSDFEIKMKELGLLKETLDADSEVAKLQIEIANTLISDKTFNMNFLDKFVFKTKTTPNQATFKLQLEIIKELISDSHFDNNNLSSILMYFNRSENFRNLLKDLMNSDYKFDKNKLVQVAFEARLHNENIENVVKCINLSEASGVPIYEICHLAELNKFKINNSTLENMVKGLARIYKLYPEFKGGGCFIEKPSTNKQLLIIQRNNLTITFDKETGEMYNTFISNLNTNSNTISYTNLSNGITIERTKTNIAGEYNICEINNGHKFVIGLVEYDKKGNLHIEKNLTSLDGTKTNTIYIKDSKGNEFNYHEIKDRNGNILFNKSDKFRIIDEKHFVTTNNENSFDVQIFENRVVITRLDKNGKVSNKIEYFIRELPEELNIANQKEYLNEKANKLLEKTTPKDIYMEITKGERIISPKCVELLKQLSGAEWEAMFKSDIIIVSELSDNLLKEQGRDKNSAYTLNGMIILGSDAIKEPFTYLHELGHMKYKLLNLGKDPELIKIYNEELAMAKSLPHEIKEAISYFIENKQALEETAAETNGIINSIRTREFCSLRTSILQQYFPKTIAYIAKEFNKLGEMTSK